MKTDKLKGKFREKNMSYGKVALYLGVSKTTINNKINGKTSFYLDEIEKLSTLLNLTIDEKVDIFLS